jgi:hypothetical protein
MEGAHLTVAKCSSPASGEAHRHTSYEVTVITTPHGTNATYVYNPDEARSWYNSLQSDRIIMVALFRMQVLRI